jgi:hypothetical protein
MQKYSKEQWESEPIQVIENVIERLKNCIKKMREHEKKKWVDEELYS